MKFIRYSKLPTKLQALARGLSLILLIMILAIGLVAVRERSSVQTMAIQTRTTQTAPKSALLAQTDNSTILELKTTAVPLEVTSHFSLGIALSDYQNTNNTVTSLEKQLDVQFSTLSIYKQFGLEANSLLRASDTAFTKHADKHLLIAWEPWNPEEEMEQSIDYLSAIVNGEFDAYIIDFARSLKEHNAPVTLRFAHEMNGDWYPWGNRADEYKAAYTYIFRIFQKEQVDNVRWMWSINSENIPASPIANAHAFYPGDEYVDVIGIDGFNFGTTQVKSEWRSFTQIFQPVYEYLIEKYDKPIIVSEFASAEEGGSKSEWLKDLFAEEINSFPEITEMVWFHFLKEADWRINSSDSSLGAFGQPVM